MFEKDEEKLTAGGVFLVDSVDAFYEENRTELTFVKVPIDIPIRSIQRRFLKRASVH